MTIDIDSDVALYNVELSDEGNRFFNEIVQKHKELFNDPPEEDWIYDIGNGTALTNYALQPEKAESVLDVITEVYQAGAFSDERYNKLMEEIEFVPRDDDQVPNALLD